MSSTWGQHTCMYVAGTAIALATAAIKPNSPCRGRCLLEEDGMVEIEAPANQSNKTNPIQVPIANLTDFFNATNSTTSASSSEPSISSGKNSLPPGLLPGLPPLESPLQASPILTCPCNCTYVSAACCLSRTVWEERSNQIQMQPLLANASVRCNTGSGKWVQHSANLTGIEYKLA